MKSKKGPARSAGPQKTHSPVVVCRQPVTKAAQPLSPHHGISFFSPFFFLLVDSFPSVAAASPAFAESVDAAASAAGAPPSVAIGTGLSDAAAASPLATIAA